MDLDSNNITNFTCLLVLFCLISLIQYSAEASASYLIMIQQKRLQFGPRGALLLTRVFFFFVLGGPLPPLVHLFAGRGQLLHFASNFVALLARQLAHGTRHPRQQRVHELGTLWRVGRWLADLRVRGRAGWWGLCDHLRGSLRGRLLALLSERSSSGGLGDHIGNCLGARTL